MLVSLRNQGEDALDTYRKEFEEDRPRSLICSNLLGVLQHRFHYTDHSDTTPTPLKNHWLIYKTMTNGAAQHPKQVPAPKEKGRVPSSCTCT